MCSSLRSFVKSTRCATGAWHQTAWHGTRLHGTRLQDHLPLTSAAKMCSSLRSFVKSTRCATGAWHQTAWHQTAQDCIGTRLHETAQHQTALAPDCMRLHSTRLLVAPGCCGTRVLGTRVLHHDQAIERHVKELSSQMPELPPPPSTKKVRRPFVATAAKLARIIFWIGLRAPRLAFLKSKNRWLTLF